jgi:hypothetical protein
MGSHLLSHIEHAMGECPQPLAEGSGKGQASHNHQPLFLADSVTSQEGRGEEAQLLSFLSLETSLETLEMKSPRNRA